VLRDSVWEAINRKISGRGFEKEARDQLEKADMGLFDEL